MHELHHNKTCFMSSSKVIGYTYNGGNSTILLLASLLDGGQLLKERICSCWSKFFPVRVDPVLEGRHCLGKQTGRLKNLFVLKLTV